MPCFTVIPKKNLGYIIFLLNRSLSYINSRWESLSTLAFPFCNKEHWLPNTCNNRATQTIVFTRRCLPQSFPATDAYARLTGSFGRVMAARHIHGFDCVCQPERVLYRLSPPSILSCPATYLRTILRSSDSKAYDTTHQRKVMDPHPRRIDSLLKACACLFFVSFRSHPMLHYMPTSF